MHTYTYIFIYRALADGVRRPRDRLVAGRFGVRWCAGDDPGVCTALLACAAAGWGAAFVLETASDDTGSGRSECSSCLPSRSLRRASTPAPSSVGPRLACPALGERPRSFPADGGLPFRKLATLGTGSASLEDAAAAREEARAGTAFSLPATAAESRRLASPASGIQPVSSSSLVLPQTRLELGVMCLNSRTRESLLRTRETLSSSDVKL